MEFEQITQTFGYWQFIHDLEFKIVPSTYSRNDVPYNTTNRRIKPTNSSVVVQIILSQGVKKTKDKI